MLLTNSRVLRALGALGLAAAMALFAGCGGGGSGGGGGGSGSSASNAVTVTVASGVGRVVNIPTVSVTVCAPGTTNCQTIDNIQVDTESFGLRLVNTAASGVLGSLPQETTGGQPLAECTQFADGFTWGTVRTADVKIGGEAASAVPIQIIGDLAASTVPTGCANGTNESTVAQLGANGILGVGVALEDCGALCVASPLNSNYYACPNNSSTCAQTAVTLAQQVANPVSRFAADNNGVVFTMGAVGANGAPSVTGTLIFGIGTRSNNAMAASTKFATNPAGDVNGTFNGSPVQRVFFDSGSNAYFFTDNTLTACSGNVFYCPSSTTTRNVSVASFNPTPGAANGTVVAMTVANTDALLASGNFAFNDLAGNLGQSFMDIGMPFFYGRTVYYGFDQSASGGASPFIAF